MIAGCNSRLVYAEVCAHYRNEPASVLANELIDIAYNAFCSCVCDVGPLDHDPHGERKIIPYLGMFWSDIYFSCRVITIAKGPRYIGFCENNDWGFPERRLTDEEFDKVMEFIDRARYEEGKGGLREQTTIDRNKVLGELWAYVQTLVV